MNIYEKVTVINNEILKEARSIKEKLIAEEKEKWEQEYLKLQEELDLKEEKMLKDFQQEAEKRKEQLFSRAIIDSRKRRRSRINDFIDKLIDELLLSLKEFRSQEAYPLFLKSVIQEAVNLLETKQAIIGLNKEDREIYSSVEPELKKALPDVKFILKDEPLMIEGGVVVEELEGNGLVDYSFKSCLEMIREELVKEVQEKVFEIGGINDQTG
jgi:vacuolar-type H+-ATPase subunit E/Vma4